MPAINASPPVVSMVRASRYFKEPSAEPPMPSPRSPRQAQPTSSTPQQHASEQYHPHYHTSHHHDQPSAEASQQDMEGSKHSSRSDLSSFSAAPAAPASIAVPAHRQHYAKKKKMAYQQDDASVLFVARRSKQQ